MHVHTKLIKSKALPYLNQAQEINTFNSLYLYFVFKIILKKI